MSIIGFFLILLLVYFVLLPALRVWGTIRRARRQARDFFGGDPASRGYGQRQSRQQERPQKHRKKIDPNVGEYVDFEDIPTYNGSSTTYISEEETTITYTEEEQVSDAEWEDIKS